MKLSWPYSTFALPAILFTLIISVGSCSLERGKEREPGIRPPDKNAITNPQTGQWILKDELVILADDNFVNEVLRRYSGELTVAVPETGTYQVRFPVTSLTELDSIKLEIEKQGVEVMYVPLTTP